MLFTCLSVASAAAADDPPLTAFVNHLSYRHRSGGPSMVDIALNQPGGDLLRGRLHVNVIGFESLAQLVTGELSLTGGQRRIRLMLPPLNTHIGIRTLELRLTFVSDAAAIDLGTHSLPMPDRIERSTVVAICDGSESSVGSAKVALGQSLRLERFVDRSRGRNALATWPALLTPAQLPTQPLALCCYDIVVLLPEGFARAEGRQLDALKYWTEAGGSLLIFSDGSGLEARHLDFLNALAARDAVPRTFGLKAGGGLSISPALNWPGAELPLAVNQCELGRCVVVAGAVPDEKQLKTETWLSHAAFLWRVHPDRLSEVRRNPGSTLATHLDTHPTGAEPIEQPVEEFYDPSNESRYANRRRQDFSVRDGQEVSALVALLMPRNIRVIPFGTVALILLALTAAIGPLDYFVLGLFRGRRFTWITFPLMCVVFTLVTVAVANHNMGQAEPGRKLVINDVDEDGRVLRQMRYELTFAGREAILDTTLTGALYAPMSTFGSYDYYDYGRLDDDGNPSNEDAPPVYTGWLTGQHTVSRVVRQWTPTLGRITAIAPAMDAAGDAGLSPAGIDWKAGETFAIESEGEITVEQLRKALNVDAGASVALLDERNNWTRSVIDPSLHQRFAGVDDFYDSPYERRYQFRPPGTTENRDFPPLLTSICVSEEAGLWSVVSQVSPHGSGVNDDLMPPANLDGTRAPILIVVREVGDQIVVHRRRCAASARVAR